MPIPGVRSQLLPLHGELSTRSLAPATKTLGWVASIANAGSFWLLGRYGVIGLPTETLLSGDNAPAVVGGATTAASHTNETTTTTRRVLIDSSSRKPLPPPYSDRRSRPSTHSTATPLPQRERFDRCRR